MFMKAAPKWFFYLSVVGGFGDSCNCVLDWPAGVNPTVVPTIWIDFVPPKYTGLLSAAGCVAAGVGLVGCTSRSRTGFVAGFANGQIEPVRQPMNAETRKTELAIVANCRNGFAFFMDMASQVHFSSEVYPLYVLHHHTGSVTDTMGLHCYPGFKTTRCL
jgi:hypothetical protein